jgi:hypothetical protein
MGNVSSPKFILSSVFLSGIDWWFCTRFVNRQ